MSGRYPSIEPYASGMLDVGDGNLVYWEICGNPNGKAALVVHGGPGSGCSTGTRRLFDPQRYRTVLFDQRGCGRSVPHAGDPDTDMSCNTTWHLLHDMEQLREHLGIDRWLLFGGSWGSTLALAYAQQHPQRVAEMILVSVTTTRRTEIDWLYRGVARFLPGQWEQFRDALPASEHGRDLVQAYATLMQHHDPTVRLNAAAAWCSWEDAVISYETGGKPGAYSNRPQAALLAFVTICTHYFAHGAWLDEGTLIDNAGLLAGIPGVLIHGRLDLGGPLETAWQLAKAWPGAQLEVIDDAGHTGSATMGRHILDALDRFAYPINDPAFRERL